MVLTADLRSRMRRVLASVLAVVVIAMGAVTVASTVTATRAGAVSTTNNGDDARDGWYPDEPNLSPASITSGDFGQLFSTQLTGAVYGQPLLDDGVLVVTTEADWIYGLDPVSGDILWSRNVGTAFNEGSQEGCGDLLLSGITATPVVDPSTGILYFTDKQYISGDTGNPQYWLHAINPTTGAEEPNFPVLYQGPADNDPTQSFNAYYQDQRPGLLLLGGVVYAAFGSTCDYGTLRGVGDRRQHQRADHHPVVRRGGPGPDRPGRDLAVGFGDHVRRAGHHGGGHLQRGHPARPRHGQRPTRAPWARAWSGSMSSPTASSNRSTSSPRPTPRS